ncbi:hypothetical protein BJ508DRAFT_379069 [Ascobolus immersus RN42]|uniref:Uncharacterized protein n=1 Tax=Ascobolus immersus RN42 TaxID=1160509 RepID=A0A3N4HZ79_ASCIM|nr:hypothetical protein BJ508DRAFT_379069 [Ascobolus immersus RN42]
MTTATTITGELPLDTQMYINFADQAIQLLEREENDDVIHLCDRLLNRPGGLPPFFVAHFISLKGLAFERDGFYLSAKHEYEKSLAVWNRLENTGPNEMQKWVKELLRLIQPKIDRRLYEMSQPYEGESDTGDLEHGLEDDADNDTAEEDDDEDGADEVHGEGPSNASEPPQDNSRSNVQGQQVLGNVDYIIPEAEKEKGGKK